MPKSCCVSNCSNNCKTNSNVQFYVIPNDKERRQRWLRAIIRNGVDDDGKIFKGKLCHQNRSITTFAQDILSLVSNHNDNNIYI